MAVLIAEFHGYLASPDADPPGDSVSHRQAVIWLDDTELADLVNRCAAIPTSRPPAHRGHPVSGGRLQAERTRSTPVPRPLALQVRASRPAPQARSTSTRPAGSPVVPAAPGPGRGGAASRACRRAATTRQPAGRIARSRCGACVDSTANKGTPGLLRVPPGTEGTATPAAATGAAVAAVAP